MHYLIIIITIWAKWVFWKRNRVHSVVVNIVSWTVCFNMSPVLFLKIKHGKKLNINLLLGTVTWSTIVANPYVLMFLNGQIVFHNSQLACFVFNRTVKFVSQMNISKLLKKRVRKKYPIKSTLWVYISSLKRRMALLSFGIKRQPSW